MLWMLEMGTHFGSWNQWSQVELVCRCRGRSSGTYRSINVRRYSWWWYLFQVCESIVFLTFILPTCVYITIETVYIMVIAVSSDISIVWLNIVVHCFSLHLFPSIMVLLQLFEPEHYIFLKILCFPLLLAFAPWCFCNLWMKTLPFYILYDRCCSTILFGNFYNFHLCICQSWEFSWSEHDCWFDWWSDICCWTCTLGGSAENTECNTTIIWYQLKTSSHFESWFCSLCLSETFTYIHILLLYQVLQLTLMLVSAP